MLEDRHEKGEEKWSFNLHIKLELVLSMLPSFSVTDLFWRANILATPPPPPPLRNLYYQVVRRRVLRQVILASKYVKLKSILAAFRY